MLYYFSFCSPSSSSHWRYFGWVLPPHHSEHRCEACPLTRATQPCQDQSAETWWRELECFFLQWCWLDTFVSTTEENSAQERAKIILYFYTILTWLYVFLMYFTFKLTIDFFDLLLYLLNATALLLLLQSCISALLNPIVKYHVFRSESLLCIKVFKVDKDSNRVHFLWILLLLSSNWTLRKWHSIQRDSM